MIRKTESLAYPKNPLAAIRELQELNDKPHVANGSDDAATNAAVVAPPTKLPTSSVVALPDSSVLASAESSEVAEARGSGEGSATSSATEPRRRKPPARTREDASPDESADSGDALTRAIRQMLSRPYTADPKKGPFTVSTVKIPSEVSERLGWVATLTGKAKQEILAEALKDYFAKLLEEA